MLERLLHRAFGDFVEGHAPDAFASASFFFFFLLPIAELFGQVRGDGFALAVRIGCEVDRIGRLRQLLQLGENFLFAGNDDVFGVEVILDIDAQGALGQVLDVAKRGLDRETLAQIFLDGFRLARRFDDD